MLANIILPIGLALTALSATAIQITEPTAQDGWQLNKNQEIKWTSVDTDPTSFTMYLELANSTSSSQDLISQTVQTSSGEYSYKPSNLPGGNGYRINFVASNGGILAQSGYFAISSATSAINPKVVVPSVLLAAAGVVGYLM